MTLSKLSALASTFVLGVSATAHAADFYVAVDGADSNPGTLAAPFASLPRAERAASAGDTVYVRGGIYKFSGTATTVGVAFTKSGAPDRPIRYVAYEGETPIFDLFELSPQQRITGLDVRCSWIHLRGLEVRGVRQVIVGDSWGVRVRGDHNVIERLHVHHNEAPGVFITSGKSNLILNCDSHHNYDPLEMGGNADGFGCHATGGDNVLRGCRAWENSDDGFDFINAAGTCIADGSWAFRNGWIPDTNTGIGNGAGFKSGGYGYPPKTPATGAARHVVRNSLAFGNRVIGFYANYHPGGIDFLNNTAFDNPLNYDMRTPGTPSTHKLRNNVSAGTGRAIANFDGGSDTFNSWTLPVQVTAADFVSLDKAIGLMPRKADGSLPDLSLARLVEGSDLIDRGEDVGLPFTGKAPDLGAYERGEPAPVDGRDAGTSGVSDAGTPIADASSPAADAGTTSIDAGQRDASTGVTPARDAAVVPPSDASASRDEDDDEDDADGAGEDPPSDPGDRTPRGDAPGAKAGGCQLHATGSGQSASSLTFAALGLALGLRRRRARPSPHR